MDNYPEELAPEFDDSGAVSTPFEVWWSQARDKFPDVPEEVGREWLHRHWSHSSFSWIPSAEYKFLEQAISSSELYTIRTLWSDYGVDNTPALEQGQFICGDHPHHTWGVNRTWLEKYMRNHRCFPSPIICLDNTDGHLETLAEAPDFDKGLPRALILVEGHRRFNIGLYLQSISCLDPKVSIFRLEKK